jgi:hypothetical protein
VTTRGLLGIRRFIVPANVLDPTLGALARVGARKAEAIVVWGGRREGTTFRFTTAFAPRQQAYVTRGGLFVRVEDEALDEVNLLFHERGLVLGGQAHSHPDEAYHSDTDNTKPLVTLLGGLSVVVPNFARGGRQDLDSFAWFRLAAYADWRPLGPETALEIE